MSRKMKEYMQGRHDGIVYCLGRVEKEGLQAVKNDHLTRDRLKIKYDIPKEAIESLYNLLNVRLYNSLKTIYLFTIHDKYGFGKKRLKDLEKHIDNNSLCLLSYDQFGNTYLKFMDMAKELNELGIDIDLETIRTIDQENETEWTKDVRHVTLLGLYEYMDMHRDKSVAEFMEFIRDQEEQQYGNTLAYDDWLKECGINYLKERDDKNGKDK